MRRIRFIIPAAIAVIIMLAAAVAVSLPQNASATTSGFNVTIPVTNRDDSGAHGNTWAHDAFSARLHLSAAGIVANTNCPGIVIGACHKFTGSITDTGTYTTIPGNIVPGNGDLNGADASTVQIGTAVTGPMHGSLPYVFYANVPLSAFAAANGPASVSGDTPSTGHWPEQFAPGGTQFWDTSGNTGGAEYLGTDAFAFTYTAVLGSDSACPNASGRWIDSSDPSSAGGANPVAGNILAPDAAHC